MQKLAAWDFQPSEGARLSEAAKTLGACALILPPDGQRDIEQILVPNGGSGTRSYGMSARGRERVYASGGDFFLTTGALDPRAGYWWAMDAEWTAVGTWSGLISRTSDNGTTAGWSWQRDGAADDIRVYHGPGSAESVVIGSLTALIAAGRAVWVGTWDGATARLYKDGALFWSAAITVVPPYTTGVGQIKFYSSRDTALSSGAMSGAALGVGRLSADGAKALGKQFWQTLIEPLRIQVPMPVSSGGGVTGTLATTNVSDTLSATGTPIVAGSLARTNANDTLAAAGTTTVTGSLAKTNANDSVAAAGSPVVAGSLAKTNADDSLAASGDVGGAVTGTLNRQNANDSLAAAGTTTVTGALATTNAPDTLTAAGSTTVVGSLAKTEGADTLQASGAAGSVTGTVAVTNRNDALDARGTAGNPQEASGGYFGAMPKSRKRVHEDRIRFGVLPRPVVKAAKRVAAKVVEQADEESPLELFREQRPRFETELKQELAALPEPPQWVDSFGLQIEIQIEAALQRRRRQRDDDDLLLMLL